MRSTALVSILLVLSGLPGLAAADRGQGGGDDPQGPEGSGAGGSGSSQPRGREPRECPAEETPAKRQRCMERVCRERPDAPACQPPCEGRAPARESCWCDEGGCDEARAFLAERRHPVAFDLLPDGSGLANYTVGPLRAIETLRIQPLEAPELERHGSVLRLRAEEARLEVHDEPGGLIRFRGGNDTLLTLAFPADAQAEADGPGFRVSYPGGPRALVVAGNASWEGSTLTASGFLSFHLAPPDRAGPARTPEERRHLGAEIELRSPGAGGEPVQVLAYDDLAVEVRLPEGASRTLRVELDANVTEGRTVAIDVDPALLDTSDPERILMRYFDVHAQGGETEVVFHRAGSLADVLDPTDDGGQPEYWIVSDGDGLHIMVSVPHWSVHAITVQGLGELVQPSVLVGVAAGAAGAALAAVAMFLPRRRRD